MFRQLKTNEDGFTLIEIMVTITIIAILTAIAIPIYNNQRKKANIASIKEDVVNTAILVEQDKARNGSYSATLPAQNNGKGGTETLNSGGVTLNIVLLSARTPPTACIQGSYTGYTAAADKYYYIMSEKMLKSGVCPTS
jgi:prepilin-type N-terminal cleavage/methylation domain-containing protein